MKRLKNLPLRAWVIGVVFLSMTLTLGISIGTGYQVNKQELISNKLADNYSYAEKLARSTDLHLRSIQDRLAVLARDLGHHIEEPSYLRKEIAFTYLKNRSNFNSLLIADRFGRVLASEPKETGLLGKSLSSEGAKLSLTAKQPMITSPFLSMAGKQVITITTPVFDKEHRYLGFISGTIALHESNMISSVLGEHSFADGSYVFVVDRSGYLIYHPDKKRLGERVTDNPMVQAVMEGKNGFQRVTNTQGVNMLAGYANVVSSEWGIVVQTPTETVLNSAGVLVQKSFSYIFPFFVVLLLLAWWLSRFISDPLLHLARYSSRLSDGDLDSPLPDLPARYYEIRELHKAMGLAVKFLRKRVEHLTNEALTDSLTGLSNRRMLGMWMQEWNRKEMPFSMIIMDVDHFKRVNDRFGHQMGDEVLKFLAQTMQQVVRKEDICCRYGGEEFVILLPDTDVKLAQAVAEQLRKKIACTISPVGKPITLSLGVASYPETTSDLTSLLSLADQALYQAKRSGRNQTIVA